MKVSPLGRQPLNSSSTLSLRPGRPPAPARSRLISTRAVGASATPVLLLSGEPIDEPVVGYGPFVMNSEAEIRQAVEDFNKGRFGSMPS